MLNVILLHNQLFYVSCSKGHNCINLAPFSRHDQNFDYKKEGIAEKISYDRHAYESVDDKWQSKTGYISKINGKQNSGTNGLMLLMYIKLVFKYKEYRLLKLCANSF